MILGRSSVAIWRPLLVASHNWNDLSDQGQSQRIDGRILGGMITCRPTVARHSLETEELARTFFQVTSTIQV